MSPFQTKILSWVVSSSWFWRQVAKTTAAILLSSGFANQSTVTAIAGAVVFLLEAAVSKFCNIQLTDLAIASSLPATRIPDSNSK